MLLLHATADYFRDGITITIAIDISIVVPAKSHGYSGSKALPHRQKLQNTLLLTN